jgi:hypothetical protein
MHRTISVSIKQPLRLGSLAFFALSVPVLFSQTEIPEWCRALPRPEHKVLQRVPISDPWFEVYKVAPAVFAIYEPHQSEVGPGQICGKLPKGFASKPSAPAKLLRLPRQLAGLYTKWTTSPS